MISNCGHDERRRLKGGKAGDTSVHGITEDGNV